MNLFQNIGIVCYSAVIIYIQTIYATSSYNDTNMTTAESASNTYLSYFWVRYITLIVYGLSSLWEIQKYVNVRELFSRVLQEAESWHN